jgi:cob(I)alamin adenosyltransferase
MAKQNKIYTKTGDDGTTGLVGGNRVKKYDIRLEAYGTVDELNAALGLLRAMESDTEIQNILFRIQNKLFNIGSRLASDEKGEEFTKALAIKESDIKILESAIDKMEEEIPELKHFILPGGDQVVAQCHVARTICRRAERRIVEFAEQEEVEKELIKFINRLSDFLFVLARFTGFRKGVDETRWEY